MTPFSASDAALEGFHLIRRRWRIVLGWAGFNLLALIMVVVVSAVLSVVASAVGGSAGGARQALGFAGLVVGFSVLFAQAILAAGVFRLEMRPEEPAFMHLRLGRDELRLVMVWLTTITGAWVLGWIAALAGHAIGAGGIWVELLAVVLAIYFGLRFSLVAPIAFNERRIHFPRSWRLTNGRVLPLLGMAALSFCLISLVMVVVLVALALIAFLTGGLDGLSGLFGGADAMQRHPGVFLLAFAIEIVLTPVLWVLAMAPLAAAYQAFAAPKTAAA
jgi:hypothetical protein